MTEIDSLIAATAGIAGTVIGIVLTHRYDDQRGKREVRLQSLPERQDSLKEVWLAFTDLYGKMWRVIHPVRITQDQREGLARSLEQLELAFDRRLPWLGPALDPIVAALTIFRRECLALAERFSEMPIQSRAPPGTLGFNWEAVVDAYSKLAASIGSAVGLDVLESELKSIIGAEKP